MRIKDCCDTSTLSLIKRIYESNADLFEVKQCPVCQTYWLYRYLEDSWWDNIQLKEDKYEKWFIPLCESELQQVYEMNLSSIGYRTGFTHITTIAPTTNSPDWKRLTTPAE